MQMKNMYPDNRIVLKECLPLEIPLCVSIEPTNLCNFKCVMCFHGNNEYAEAAKPLKNMSMECFHKVIDELKSWIQKEEKKIKLIKLYSLGEPLIHPDICEMVRLLKEANVCQQIEITTNASLLSKEVAEKLVDYGLDIFRASIYAVRKEHNAYITKSKIEPQDIFEKIKYLKEYREKKGVSYPKIYAKMIDTFSEENKEFECLYHEVADIVAIDKLFQLTSGENDAYENFYNDRADTVHKKSMETNLYGERDRKACRYPFTHMTIRNDGSVIVCCADWLKETKIGNIHKQSLKDIWESKTLYEFRCNMLKTKGLNIDVCRKCEIPYRNLPEDDIDDFPIEKLSYKEGE